MPLEPLLAGLDVGTSNAKGGVFDLAGHPLALASASYAISRPQPGWAEQDPEAWWRAVLAILGDLAGQVDLARVAAVGVCSQVNTHVFVDEAGQSLGPAITWQDQRCAGIAAAIDGSLAEADRVRLWGGPFTVDPSFLLPRVRWFKQHQPEAWPRVRWVLSPKDYINLRLTGHVATDPISPIGLVGTGRRYIDGVLDLVPECRPLMPPLRPFTHRLGSVSAAETGLPAETTAVVATMDAWGNLYGSGLIEPGQAMEVAGTSEIVGVLSAESHPARGVITFLPVDGLYLHAGPTQAGGDALRWLTQVLGRPLEETLAQAADAPAGSGGLVFLPYLMGERAPLWDAEARGVFFGLRADHAAGHLAMAVLEGVAFSARHLLEAIREAAGLRPPAVRSSGGGSRSDLWCQVKADVLGLPVHRLSVRDTGVLGAALMAGVGAGLFPSLPAAAAGMVHVERAFTPNPGHQPLYDDLYGLYRSLYPALKPAFSRLQSPRPHA
ncbi:MAG: xylulokinase [Chloroflexota bacterium]